MALVIGQDSSCVTSSHSNKLGLHFCLLHTYHSSLAHFAVTGVTGSYEVNIHTFARNFSDNQICSRKEEKKTLFTKCPL